MESSQGEESREASPEGDDWLMVEKSGLTCDSGLVSTTAEGEGVVGGQEGGYLNSSDQGGVSDTTEGEVEGADSTEGTGSVSDSEITAESTWSRWSWGKG